MENDTNIIDFVEQCNKTFFNDYFKKSPSISKDNVEVNTTVEIPKVSELHMHKILYYSYGFFYSKFKKELFIANFEAWKYGPVEKKYREYIKTNNEDIKKEFNIKLDLEEESFLMSLIFKLINLSPYILVSESHNTKPWIDNYNVEQWKKIPNNEIKMFFGDKGKD